MFIRSCSILSLILLWVMFFPTLAWGATCEVRSVPGGLHCTDEEGQIQWERMHPVLVPENMDADAEGIARASEVPLLLQNDRVLYGVRGDLLEADRETGRVLNRTRYPLRIVELRAEGSDVKVSLERGLEVIYLGPGGTAGQGLWVNHMPGFLVDDLNTTWLDAFRLHAAFEQQDADDERLSEAFRLGARQDETNPFFYLELGAYLELSERAVGHDDESEAAKVYQRALAPSQVLWIDWLLLSGQLEAKGRPDEARVAFSRAQEAMASGGFQPERFLGRDLLILYRPLGSLISNAFEEGDADRVDELFTGIADVFPLMEGGSTIYGALHEWFEEQGRQDLSAPWAARAERAQVASPLDFASEVDDANRLALPILAIVYALLLGGLVLGLHSGRRRRRDGEGSENGGETGKPKKHEWMPKVPPRDLLMPLVFFIALVPLTLLMATTMVSIQEKFSVPTGLKSDGLAAPEVSDWVKERAPSEARDQLLAIAEAEREAFHRGEVIIDRPPIHELLKETMAADLWKRTLLGLRAEMQVEPRHHIIFYPNFDHTEIGGNGSPLRLVGLMILFGLLLLLGHLLALYVPRAWRGLTVLVPGALGMPSALGMVVLLIFCAGALGISGNTNLFDGILSYYWVHFHYLEQPDGGGANPSWFAWLALLGAFGLHIVGVVRARRTGLDPQ